MNNLINAIAELKVTKDRLYQLLERRKKVKKIILLFMMLCTLSMIYAGEWYENETTAKQETVKETKIPTCDMSSFSTLYIITFEISQSHLSLDLTEHLKDAMNKLTFEVPVDVDYFNKLKIGDIVSNQFRTGSLIAKGSIGKWKIRVIDKRTCIRGE